MNNPTFEAAAREAGGRAHSERSQLDELLTSRQLDFGDLRREFGGDLHAARAKLRSFEEVIHNQRQARREPQPQLLQKVARLGDYVKILQEQAAEQQRQQHQAITANRSKEWKQQVGGMRQVSLAAAAAPSFLRLPICLFRLCHCSLLCRPCPMRRTTSRSGGTPRPIPSRARSAVRRMLRCALRTWNLAYVLLQRRIVQLWRRRSVQL